MLFSANNRNTCDLRPRQKKACVNGCLLPAINRTQTVASSLLRFARASSDLRTQGMRPNDLINVQRQAVKGQGCHLFSWMDMLLGGCCIQPILNTPVQVRFGETDAGSANMTKLC